MHIVVFIEDEPLVKKILKSAVGGSSEYRCHEQMPRLLKPSIIYDDSPAPCVDAYLIIRP
jgi:hypothetical protein